jgi:5-methylcytosine-specific restriction endonuclease McrA
MKLRHYEPRQRYRKKKNSTERKELWLRAHGRCWYCGAKVGKKAFRLDHQEPFSKGGADSNRNLVVSCADCDGDKGAMGVEEYRLKLGGVQFYGEAQAVR